MIDPRQPRTIQDVKIGDLVDVMRPAYMWKHGSQKKSQLVDYYNGDDRLLGVVCRSTWSRVLCVVDTGGMAWIDRGKVRKLT